MTSIYYGNRKQKNTKIHNDSRKPNLDPPAFSRFLTSFPDDCATYSIEFKVKNVEKKCKKSFFFFYPSDLNFEFTALHRSFSPLHYYTFCVSIFRKYFMENKYKILYTFGSLNVFKTYLMYCI